MQRAIRSPQYLDPPGPGQSYVAHQMAGSDSHQSGRCNEPLAWLSTRATDNCTLTDAHGRTVIADIDSKVDKGFFREDGDWTCYRRNYFAVACSYTLNLDGGGSAPADAGQCFVRGDRGSSRPADRFAMCISACVNEDESRTIELVQHTPKRDKGPRTPPQKTMVKVNRSGHLSSPGSSRRQSGSVSSMYAATSTQFHYAGAERYNSSAATAPPLPPPPPTTPLEDHTSVIFERIQFQKATANNGKRRAQQQYFHIKVELYAGHRRGAGAMGGPHSSDGGSIVDYEWVQIASRLSAQLVVRGRSPGHYTESHQHSSHNGLGGAGMPPGGGANGRVGGGNMSAPSSAGGSGSRGGGGGGSSLQQYSMAGSSHMHSTTSRLYPVSSSSRFSTPPYMRANNLSMYPEASGLDLGAHAMGSVDNGSSSNSSNGLHGRNGVLGTVSGLQYHHDSSMPYDSYCNTATTQTGGLLSPTTTAPSPSCMSPRRVMPHPGREIKCEQTSSFEIRSPDYERTTHTLLSPYENTLLTPGMDHAPRWPQRQQHKGLSRQSHAHQYQAPHHHHHQQQQQHQQHQHQHDLLQPVDYMPRIKFGSPEPAESKAAV